MRAPLGRRCGLRAGLLSAALLLLRAAPGLAVQAGHLETFPGTTLQGWEGGDTLSNPGSGGLGGGGDGYLVVSRSVPDKLGAFASTPPYLGNWTAAGIRAVSLWLNDVNAADDLEIHVGVGADLNAATPNLWLYNPGFVPPHGSWSNFTVDLTDSTRFTRIIGSAPFAAALLAVTRLLVRHDKPPFIQQPDLVAGDFGIDDVLLVGPPALGVPPTGRAGVERPVELLPPAPNPSRGPVAFTVRHADGAVVRIDVLDPAGRRIRQAELPASPSPFRIWTWDGLDEAGRRAAPGVYRVRAIGAGGGSSLSFVRCR